MMTKIEAVESFKSSYENIKLSLKNDRVAVVTDWSFYIDGLHRDDLISDWQVNNWTNPFDNRK